jgi:hypothetical protein
MAPNNTATKTRVSAKPKAPRGKKPVADPVAEIDSYVWTPDRIISFGNRYGERSTAMILWKGMTLHVHRDGRTGTEYVYQPDPKRPVMHRFNLTGVKLTPPSKPRKPKGNQRRK